ncbi:CDP-alcohol phosphatidyltransferase family protein [Candidatus Woesearchaeota archaeon]|nr:CDP-alcohol phosphatidyltransferase family protein [Candidatus Woesearchaeota archaeon]
MYYNIPYLTRLQDKAVEPFVKVLYERLRIEAHNLTYLNLLLSLTAAVFFFLNSWQWGYVLLATALFIDFLDGPMARIYQKTSVQGERLDMMVDRVAELTIFLALVLNGTVSIFLALAAYYAIILVTVLSRKTRLDLGGKRTFLFFGIFMSFNVVFALIFFFNLGVFILQLLVLDYRNDKKTYFSTSSYN